MSQQGLKQQIIEKAWSDEEFKAKLIASPKTSLRESFDLSLPDDMELVIVEESAKKLTIVIPNNPSKLATAQSDVNNTW